MPKSKLSVACSIACLMLIVGGCANIRLPAIDPSGRSLLLPWTQSTSINSHDQYLQGPPSTNPIARSLGIPGPIFREPGKTGSCPESFVSPSLATSQVQGAAQPAIPVESTVPRVLVPGCFQDPRGRIVRPQAVQAGEGRVTLSPRRHVAPVGTEVPIVGGVCDGDGYYVMREPIEWALQQGSVGTFAEPGRTSRSILGGTHLLNGKAIGQQLFGGLLTDSLPELLSNNYALGCTSKRTQVLTRGTPDPSDDVFLKKGQTWIGVTSAQEGNSYVTMYAPELDSSLGRSATSVIHWIDGRWTLPDPAVSLSGEPQTLTTQLNRQLSGNPISGWLVRYEITGGAPATFADGSRVKEVYSDASGRASVRVVPTDGSVGTTQIQTQIIRPTTWRGEPDRLLVGQGYTSVTWNSSNLEARLEGPNRVELRDEANYRIEVFNPGNVDAKNVTVRSFVPAGMEYVASNPAGQLFGGSVDWDLGTLAAGQRQTVDVTYRAVQSGTVRHCISARSENTQPIEDCLSTNVGVNALFIDAFGPPEEQQIEVGQLARYQFKIVNRGDRTLDDVLAVARFGDGIVQRTLSSNQQKPDSSGPIRKNIGKLAPGESDEFALNFVVVRPGEHCFTLESSATGARSALVERCLLGVEPARPALRIVPPENTQMTLGEEKTFELRVENTGDVALSNLQIVAELDPALVPIAATPSANNGQGWISWLVEQPIPPGESREFLFRCRANLDVQEATSRVLVTGPNGLQDAGSFSTSILPRRDPNEGRFEPRGDGFLGGQDRGNDGGLGANGLDPGDEFDLDRGIDPGRDNIDPRNPRAFDPNDLRRRDDLRDDFRDDNLNPRNGQGADEGINDGRLSLSIDGRSDQTLGAGNDQYFIDYLFVIQNDDDIDDSDVVLDLQLPKNITFEKYYGETPAASWSNDWRRIQMKPIRTLRPGEKVVYQVRVRVSEPGEVLARAQVTSFRSPNPIVKDHRWMQPQ